MKMLVRSAALMSLLLGALGASAQDVLSVASTSANAGTTASVAVYLQDVAGTPLGYDAPVGNRIQGIAFRVTYDSSKVISVTFTRAGALQNITPLYERTSTAAGSIGYLGAFAEATQPVPLSITALTGARIGTLSVQLAPSLANGTVIPLTLDPAVSTLSNQVATAFENRYNRKLTLSSGSVVIGGTSTTTALGSNPNPSTTGTAVTFTATISSATAGGTMTFYDGSNAIGFATVSSGQASFTTSALSAGTHSITAAYEGDATYLPSTSSSVSQSVQHVLNAPAGLAAQATSTTSATLSWPAVQDATSYEIRRRSSSTNGTYVVVGATSNTNFTDNNLAPDSAYLYVVYAMNGGGYSPASTPDPVTTVAFSDDPLVAGTTLVKAAHLNELRAAVNALRAIQALPPAVFTDGSLAGQPIRAMHLQELRSAVSTVRSILGVPAPAFTDPTITTQSTAVRAVHVQDLRSAVR